MKPIPYDEMTALRISEGNLHETDVVLRLQVEDSATITRQQEEINLHIGSITADDPPIVQGHIDGVIEDDFFGGPRLLEIKSMGKSAFAAFKAKGWEAGGLIDKYQWQLSCYMHGTGLEALLVAKSRDSGELLRMPVEIPFYNMSEIADRVAYIEDHVSRGRLPEDCPHDWFCSFKYLCQTLNNEPGSSNEVENEPVNDPMFEDKLRRYNQFNEDIKRMEGVKAELKTDIDAWLKLSGRTKARVGDYTVTWITREIPESVRKATTQSFPQVKRIEGTDNAAPTA